MQSENPVKWEIVSVQSRNFVHRNQIVSPWAQLSEWNDSVISSISSAFKTIFFAYATITLSFELKYQPVILQCYYGIDYRLSQTSIDRIRVNPVEFSPSHKMTIILIAHEMTKNCHARNNASSNRTKTIQNSSSSHRRHTPLKSVILHSVPKHFLHAKRSFCRRTILAC